MFGGIVWKGLSSVGLESEVCHLLYLYPFSHLSHTSVQQWYRPHTILIFHSVSYIAWGPQQLPFLEDVHGLESNIERLCDVCDQEDRWLKRSPLVL